MSAAVRQWLRGWGGLALLITLGTGSLLLWALDLPDGTPATASFPPRALLLFALQLAAAAVAWSRRDRGALAVVLAAAVGFRLAALTWTPVLSSDLYRYVWDGRVQLAGDSPYAAPPVDERLAGLRDQEIWPRINRPEAITVYPPGAQVVFLGLAAAGVNTVGEVRAAAALAELVALALLVIALQRRRAGAGALILYAWSPLVIAEVCVSGHLDALVLPLVLGGLLVEGAAAGVLIGMAGMLKLYPFLLLGVLPRGTRLRAAVAAGAVAVGCYLPYLVRAGAGVLGFLPDYARSGEDFNPSLRGFAEQAAAPFTDHARALAMAAAAVGLIAVWIALARRRDVDALPGARRLALAFVLLLPTAVHPWYALWLVPLLALSPSAAGVWIVGTLPLCYLKYSAPGEVMPAWIPLVEWLPALALLALTRVRAQPAPVEAA
ncbi:MAG TPA: glycosyltransferase 87 family protein [Kofleriaceae bacterium]|nr:glycosyltransferase 87 family protein [Kofleriaceae bacterium]